MIAQFRCRAPWCGLLGVLLLLAGCGDLPRPFAGNPGATALRLARPPPSRLAVPTPGAALLGDQAAAGYAAAVASALVDQEVPAVAAPAGKDDWRLDLTAERRGGAVVPGFTVVDPTGAPQGKTEGDAVATAAWSQGSTATLRRTAATAAPAVATLLTRIDAARRGADPHSLLNRPARVWLKPVTGAPGDGNTSLTRQMREQLSQQALVVQDTASGTDFTVQGDVATQTIAGDQQRVEIIWVVTDAENRECGRVAQLNEVPRGSLNGLWADVALVVAREAAGGIHDVIANHIGGKPAAKP
jgi:hypothetical protein